MLLGEACAVATLVTVAFPATGVSRRGRQVCLAQRLVMLSRSSKKTSGRALGREAPPNMEFYFPSVGENTAPQSSRKLFPRLAAELRRRRDFSVGWMWGRVLLFKSMEIAETPL